MFDDLDMEIPEPSMQHPPPSSSQQQNRAQQNNRQEDDVDQYDVNSVSLVYCAALH